METMVTYLNLALYTLALQVYLEMFAAQVSALPAGGTTGQVLMRGGDGSAVWGDPPATLVRTAQEETG